MMARLQVDKDEHTATATQHATKIASANQANATMESQMQTLLTQVQALQLANTPTKEETTASDADAEAALVGALDVPNRRPHAPQSTAGPTVTSVTVAKNAHILSVDIIRKRPSPTL